MKKNLLILGFSLVLFSFGSKSKSETSSTPQYLKDYNAGVRAQNEKDYPAAIEFYQRSLDQKPDFADAWNNLGYCYRVGAKSYLAKAGSAYQKALRYDSNHEQALEYQGEYFVMVGDLEDAYKNYQKLKQMGSDEAEDLKEKLDEVLDQAQSVLKKYSP